MEIGFGSGFWPSGALTNSSNFWSRCFSSRATFFALLSFSIVYSKIGAIFNLYSIPLSNFDYICCCCFAYIYKTVRQFRFPANALKSGEK